MIGSYRIERSDTGCSVYIEGGLTAAVVPELQQKLAQELAASSSFVFDLQGTDYIDSGGIGLLIAACNSLQKRHATMRVVNVRPDIYKLLHSMRLVARLNVTGCDQPGPVHG